MRVVNRFNMSNQIYTGHETTMDSYLFNIMDLFDSYPIWESSTDLGQTKKDINICVHYNFFSIFLYIMYREISTTLFLVVPNWFQVNYSLLTDYTFPRIYT